MTHAERGHPPTATACPGPCPAAIAGIAMACAVAPDEIQLPTATLSSHHFLCMFYGGSWAWHESSPHVTQDEYPWFQNGKGIAHAAVAATPAGIILLSSRPNTTKLLLCEGLHTQKKIA